MPFVIVLAASLPQILIFSCWVNFELLWILNTSKYYIYILLQNETTFFVALIKANRDMKSRSKIL